MASDLEVVSTTPQPVYFDGLFKDPDPEPLLPCPRLSSQHDSLTLSRTTSSDVEPAFLTRMPSIESTTQCSIRSKKSFFRPRRLRWGSLFARPVSSSSFEAQCTRSSSIAAPLPIDEWVSIIKPTVLKNKSSFPPARGARAYAKRPLPQVPVFSPQELSCDRCYYFAARNCNGWVLGGATGDACEGCLQAGFFGAK